LPFFYLSGRGEIALEECVNFKLKYIIYQANVVASLSNVMFVILNNREISDDLKEELVEELLKVIQM
jgi:hypothetical protein